MMQVAERPPSLLIRQALERAGLASLLDGGPGTTLSRTHIEALLRPENALLSARIAHQRRLTAWGLATTYCRTGDGEATDLVPMAPAFADWAALLAWATAHPLGVGPEPMLALTLATATGLSATAAGLALTAAGLTAMAPAPVPLDNADGWHEAMVALADAGLALTIAVPFAANETPLAWAERACQLRRWQATQRFATAMLPIPAEPGDRPALEILPTGFGVLQMVSLCRILVDNVPHLSVDWSRIGIKLSQIALSCGADDWIGDASVDPGDSGGPVHRGLLAELIQVAGQTPVVRDAAFTVCRS
ncbi:MAG: hypothetical protein H7338_22155 [Candidatus Sericytochromatia bacterium]|nr:hypothetical protein [Candidatus Sericytochromatia bacterium]